MASDLACAKEPTSFALAARAEPCNRAPGSHGALACPTFQLERKKFPGIAGSRIFILKSQKKSALFNGGPTKPWQNPHRKRLRAPSFRLSWGLANETIKFLKKAAVATSEAKKKAKAEERKKAFKAAKAKEWSSKDDEQVGPEVVFFTPKSSHRKKLTRFCKAAVQADDTAARQMCCSVCVCCAFVFFHSTIAQVHTHACEHKVRERVVTATQTRARAHNELMVRCGGCCVCVCVCT